jgi:hypothetical protein
MTPARAMLATLRDHLGMHVEAREGRLHIRPASRLNEQALELVRLVRDELVALLEAEAARRDAIAARLVAWGWPATLAADTARRIVMRKADDARRTCAECGGYRPATHKCASHHQRLLDGDDVGRHLASLPQHCAGFVPLSANDQALAGC